MIVQRSIHIDKCDANYVSAAATRDAIPNERHFVWPSLRTREHVSVSAAVREYANKPMCGKVKFELQLSI